MVVCGTCSPQMLSVPGLVPPPTLHPTPHPQSPACARSYDTMHQGQYLGFNGLRAMSNPRLQALWHDAGLQVLQFAEGTNGTVPPPTTVQDSLFNVGAMLASAAREVAYATTRGSSLADNRQWAFLLANGPGAAYQGYLHSLNFQVKGGRVCACRVWQGRELTATAMAYLGPVHCTSCTARSSIASRVYCCNSGHRLTSRMLDMLTRHLVTSVWVRTQSTTLRATVSPRLLLLCLVSGD
jgi:hypothetical protein